MRNRYLEKFDSTVKIKIVGSHVHNYLKRIFKYKIHVIRIIPISRREVHVILKYDEYEKLLQYKSIYEIQVLHYYGKKQWKKQVRKQAILVAFLMLGLGLILFLSRMVSEVEVIHQDQEIRSFLKEELGRYGIKRYTFKKNYSELEKIEDQILEENKDRLEWIEIIEYGTKYTVRVEERKLNEEESGFQYQHIISRKNAVLVRVDAIRGERVRNVNDYVAKGDRVISGFVTLPNNTTVPTMAEGTVYGEVWYRVNIDYPYVYQETNLTGNSKTVYALYFFNKRLGFLDFKKYKSFQSKNQVLFSFNMLDISFVKERQFEAIIKDEVYTEEMVESRAIQYVKDKIMKDNPYVQEIRDVMVLGHMSHEKGIRFKMFVRAIEDIGEVVAIEPKELENQQGTEDEKKD